MFRPELMCIFHKSAATYHHLKTKAMLRSCGKRSYIKNPIRITGAGDISIGSNSFVLDGARIEAVHEYNGQLFTPEIVIGNNVDIGQNLHLIAADTLVISHGVLISGNVYIGDCDHEYKIPGLPVSKQGIKVSKTFIGENCFIGYGAVIQPGSMLGRHCVVGSNAVVRKGVYPDYSVLAGVPAKVIKQNSWERKSND